MNNNNNNQITNNKLSQELQQQQQECRGVRQRKKHTDPTKCPVCGITLRSSEIEQHFNLELDRLNKISTNSKCKKSTMHAHGILSSSSDIIINSLTVTGITNGNVHGYNNNNNNNNNNNSNSNDTITSSSSSSSSSSTSPSTSQSTTTNHHALRNTAKECWTTFQKIKNNRQARLKTKSRKRKADDPICPVCMKRITDDLNEHVELCLIQSELRNNGNNRSTGSTGLNNNNNGGGDGGNGSNHHHHHQGGSDLDSDSNDSVDIIGESFDEYEWAGQTRVRASSLLDGGYSATGIGTSISNVSQGSKDDEDEVLNVDGDDSQIYGSTQYSEHDIILPLEINEEIENENLYLRQLVIGDSIGNVNGSSAAAAAAATVAAAASISATTSFCGGINSGITNNNNDLINNESDDVNNKEEHHHHHHHHYNNNNNNDQESINSLNDRTASPNQGSSSLLPPPPPPPPPPPTIPLSSSSSSSPPITNPLKRALSPIPSSSSSSSSNRLSIQRNEIHHTSTSSPIMETTTTSTIVPTTSINVSLPLLKLYKIMSTSTTKTTTAATATATPTATKTTIDLTKLKSNESASSNELKNNKSQTNQQQIIDALKSKIHEYEIQNINKSKCLICMDDFRVPVVSICCWHVHCEECWLRTLGVVKLCPQCKMITAPGDLRRIYM